MERKEAFRALVVLGTLVLALGRAAPAQYSGGAGTPEDPYQIATAQDLIDLGDTPTDYDKHFLLTADIDLSGHTFDQAVIAPGTYRRRGATHTPFTGVFAGNGHVIRHLHIEGASFLGLFGTLSTGAAVLDLGLEDASIGGGGNHVGGLVGHNSGGGLVGCYTTGTVEGSGHCAGGLVGENYYGDISNCYSACAVGGIDKVGGLVGNNVEGNIANCYSTGVVTGDDHVGGLVGDAHHGSVANSFWDTETSGVTTSYDGVGLTTVQMQEIGTYLETGWDLLGENGNGTAETWQMPLPNGYPRLSVFEGHTPVLPEGRGTMAEPFLITSATELGVIGHRPLSCYRLETDIDLAGITWSIAPVPWFDGHFDGSSHVISRLSIRGGGLLGLFGSLHANSTIVDLGLEDSAVEGTDRFVGSLAGCSEATVVNCYSTGNVSGADDVGALAGRNTGSLLNCHSSGPVTGTGNVGGLVGCNGDVGTVSNCYSVSTVTGTGYPVGGLVGCNDSSSPLSHCYSTGAVTGYAHVGGLVGRNANGSTISKCYSIAAVTGDGLIGGLVGTNGGRVLGSFWNTESSGRASSSGGAGLTTAEMMDPQWIGLQGWAHDPNWVLDPHQDYPRLAWEGTTGDVVAEPVIDWMAGQGTSDEPYEIDNPDQVFLISKASLLWDKDFILTKDVDLAETVWPQAIIPEFTGTLDGNSHAIARMRISGTSDLGLVGCLEEGGEILNLRLLDITVSGSGDRIGGLVGMNRRGGIWKCHTSGAVAGFCCVGGLVGRNTHGAYVSNCSSAVEVTGHERLGVVGIDGVGGLVGKNGGSVRYCYSAGPVSGDGEVGGLVGANLDGYVTDCYSTGAVAGSEHVGGVVGWILGGNVSNCYSTGTVTGHEHVGGAIGANRDKVAGIFWDVETSGLTVSDAGTGLMTTEMQDIDTYLDAGWDFVGETGNGTLEIWQIDDGQEYPRLWWEQTSEASQIPEIDDSPTPETDETTLLGTWPWDVETDTLGVGIAASDFWWQQVTATERYLVPTNGAEMAIVSERNFDEVDSAFVNEVTLSTDRVSGSDDGSVLNPGTVVVFRTAEGNTGKLRVEGYRALHDFSFPEASYLSESWKSSALTEPDIEKYHLHVTWCLF